MRIHCYLCYINLEFTISRKLQKKNAVERELKHQSDRQDNTTNTGFLLEVRFSPLGKVWLLFGKIEIGHTSEPLISTLMFNKNEKNNVAFANRIKKIILVSAKGHCFVYFNTHTRNVKRPFLLNRGKHFLLKNKQATSRKKKLN